jgi:small-conductance mechanosensitive channel
LFFTAATETLGLPVLATWLGGVSYYLPRVLVAVLIVFAGLLAGNLARDAITGAADAARLTYGSLLGQAVQGVILLIAIVTSVDQLGIESRFLTATITIVIGAIIGAAALAFGLGSRTAVSNIIAVHYLRQIYRVGHTVKVGNVHGKILEITPTAVIIEESDGRVLVPAKEFSEGISVLITGQS